MSVHISVWRNLASTGQIFMKFDTEDFYKKSVFENSDFVKIRQKYRTLCEDPTLLYDKYQN
jgi:hypothetical protein